MRLEGHVGSAHKRSTSTIFPELEEVLPVVVLPEVIVADLAVVDVVFPVVVVPPVFAVAPSWADEIVGEFGPTGLGD